MKTNPIYKLNGSGLSLGDIYSLNFTSDGNGSVYSDASIGTNGYTTTLSAVPSAGYKLSAFSADYGTINGNEYTFTTNDAVVSAFFQEQVGYQRFMWRFDDLVDDDTFQMGAIRLNDIDLPYDYITYGKGGGNFIDSQPPSAMVATITGDDPYHKWCVNEWYSDKWGWIIFDMPYDIVPKKYELQIAGDTESYPGRNPVRTRLFASTGTPTTFEDGSWELIVDSYMQLPTTNYYWVTVWEDN